MFERKECGEGESNGEDKAVQKLPLLYCDQLCNQNPTGGFFTCDRPFLLSVLTLLVSTVPACLTRGSAVCARGVEILGRRQRAAWAIFTLWTDQCARPAISSRDCPLSARARPSPIRVRESEHIAAFPPRNHPAGSRSASPFSWADDMSPTLVCAAQVVRKPKWTALDTKRAL